MPSTHAFMELSPLDIKGESGDVLFGKDTPYAMFEIFSLSFDVGGTSSKANEQTIKKDGVNFRVNIRPPTTPAPNTSTANDQDTRKGKITVSKAIDYSSPDLFRYCCEKKPIDWAIILLREAGDTPDGGSDNPWLRIEITKVHVTDFSWDVDPGAGGDESNKSEKLVFEFETMMIYYCRQLVTGGHEPPKYNQWNFAEANGSVAPIS